MTTNSKPSGVTEIMCMRCGQSRIEPEQAKLSGVCEPTSRHTFHRLGGIDDCPVCNPKQAKPSGVCSYCGTNTCGGNGTCPHEPEQAKPKGEGVREWLIKEAFIGQESGTRYPAHVTSNLSYGSYEGGMIHVIEHAAYLAVCEERDMACKVVAQVDAQLRWQKKLQAEMDALTKERDELREQLSQRILEKELAKGNAEGLLANRTRERDELRAENERLKRELASAIDADILESGDAE